MIRLLVLVFVLIFSGCTSSQKYEILLSKYNNIQDTGNHQSIKEIEILEKLVVLGISLKKKDSDIIWLYSNLGNKYAFNHKYEKAFKYYIKAKNLIDDNDIGWLTNINIRISELYWVLLKKEKAISLLEKFIETHEKELNKSVFKHMIYKKLFSFYIKDNQLDKVLQVGKSILSENNATSASCEIYNLFGDVYLKKRKYEKAEKYYLHTLNIAKKQKTRTSKTYSQIRLHKAFTQNSELFTYEDLATSYSKLGNLYRKQMKYKKAVDYLNQALKSPNLLKGNIIKIKNDLSLAHLGLEQFSRHKKSISTLEDIVSIQKNLLGEDSLPNLYEQIAQLYFKNKNYKKSYKYIKKSYDIYSKNRLNNFSILTNNEKIKYVINRETSIADLLYLAFLYQKKSDLLGKEELAKKTFTDWLIQRFNIRCRKYDKYLIK